MSKKIGLTRRLVRQQDAILRLRGSNYNHQQYFKYKYDSDANGMIAYAFAKQWSSRDIDIHALQRLIINSKSALAAFMFARDIEGASIRRLQVIVLEYGTVDQKRAFAKLPGAAHDFLMGIALVQEVMEL
jgi:hypothetical protein